MDKSGMGPTLIDPKGMGGINALDGFDYQLWKGLTMLPSSLANPTFETIIFEGLEDLEARFFAPHAPQYRLLERYQAKSGDLTPSGVREVFETFYEFEKHYPKTTRSYTLVTPQLPHSLKWLARNPKRVRLARPFYAPFGDITNASDEALKQRCTKEYGLELGTFVASAVEIDLYSIPNQIHAEAAFSTALFQSYPHLDVGQRSIKSTFDALCHLIRHNRGASLDRATLVDLIEEKLGITLFRDKKVHLLVRSDRNESDESALEIDASDFSGGDKNFPAPERWHEGIVEPFRHTAKWLISKSKKRITLGGSYRLTTAFILGWSFRSAIGFELEIPTRSGIWMTDEHSKVNEVYPIWQINEANDLIGDRLIVSIGILRDPTQDLIALGKPVNSTLSMLLEEPLTSGDAMQASIMKVKDTVSRTVSQLRPKQIDLFIAGPSAFAVALGHRWNAMPSTRLHEFQVVERKYVTTATV